MAFTKIDDDNSGELDRDEIGRVFVLYGIYLTDQELDACMSEIDEDGSGAIDIDEFLVWMRGRSSLAAKMRNELANADLSDSGGVTDCLTVTKHSLREFNQGMTQVQLFSFYDRDGDGSLSFPEFKTAIRRDVRISKYMLPDDQLREMFDQIDEDGDGDVDVAHRENEMGFNGFT